MRNPYVTNNKYLNYVCKWVCIIYGNGISFSLEKKITMLTEIKFILFTSKVYCIMN